MNTYVRIHIDTYLHMFIDINMPKFWIYIYVSCLNERTHIPQKLLYSWLQFIEMKRCISKNGQHMAWNEGGASNKFLEVLSLEKDMDIINIHRNCVSISEYCHLGKSAWSLDFSERKSVKMMHQRSYILQKSNIYSPHCVYFSKSHHHKSHSSYKCSLSGSGPGGILLGFTGPLSRVSLDAALTST